MRGVTDLNIRRLPKCFYHLSGYYQHVMNAFNEIALC